MMKIEYSDLAKDGLSFCPESLAGFEGDRRFWAASAKEFLDYNRDTPELIGFVPNLPDFTTGCDYNVGAFEIKAENTDLVSLPGNLAFLLPMTSLILNDFYRHAGKLAADQCQVSLQFFRGDTKRSEHLLFDKIHRHAAEGKLVIYVVTAMETRGKRETGLLGTEFYTPEVLGKRIARPKVAATAADFQDQFAKLGVVQAPGGAIIRFSENTLHAAPDVTQGFWLDSGIFTPLGGQKLRRSLINIIASLKEGEGSVYGRQRPPNPHRASPVENGFERQQDYKAAANRILAQSSSLETTDLGTREVLNDL